MKKIFLIWLSMLFLLSGCGKQKSTELMWQEQYDLGVRYLSEGNYEEAIIVFMTAIEIDPKRVETYVALADVYDKTNDTEKVFEILELGVAATDDEGLKELLEKLEAERGATESTTETSAEMSAVDSKTNGEDNWREIVFEDLLTTDDIPLAYMDFEEAVSYFGADSINEYSDGLRANGESVSLGSDKSGKRLESLGYYGGFQYGDNIEMDIGIRGIRTGDSMETVLIKMGIEADSARWVSENVRDVFFHSYEGQGDGHSFVTSGSEIYEGYRSIVGGFYNESVEGAMDDGQIAYIHFMFYEDKLDECSFVWHIYGRWQ